MKSFLLSVLIVSLFSISNLYSQDIKAKLKGHLAVNGFTVVDDNGKILFRVTGEGNVGILTDNPTSLFEVGRDLQTDGIPRTIFIKGESTNVDNEIGGDATIEGGNNSFWGTTGGQMKLMGGDLYDGGNVVIQAGNGTDYGGQVDILSGVASSYSGGDINISTPPTYSSGDINLTTGNSSGHAGSITIKTGAGGVGGNGINIITSDEEEPADITITAGNINHPNGMFGGSIILTPGTGDPNGLVVVNGSGTVSGNWTVASDERFKKNIEPIQNAVDKIEQLNGVSYEFKSDEYPEKNFADGRQIGLIAQEVEKVFPELVKTDAEGYKSVAYQNMVAVLLEAVKEQQKSIDELKKEVDELKNNQKTEVSTNTNSDN